MLLVHPLGHRVVRFLQLVVRADVDRFDGAAGGQVDDRRALGRRDAPREGEARRDIDGVGGVAVVDGDRRTAGECPGFSECCRCPLEGATEEVGQFGERDALPNSEYRARFRGDVGELHGFRPSVALHGRSLSARAAGAKVPPHPRPSCEFRTFRGA